MFSKINSVKHPSIIKYLKSKMQNYNKFPIFEIIYMNINDEISENSFERVFALIHLKECIS